MHGTVILAPNHRALGTTLLGTSLLFWTSLARLFRFVKGKIVEIRQLNSLNLYVLEELFPAQEWRIHPESGERFSLGQSFGRVRRRRDRFEGQRELAFGSGCSLLVISRKRLGSPFRLGLRRPYFFLGDLVFTRNGIVVVRENPISQIEFFRFFLDRFAFRYLVRSNWGIRFQARFVFALLFANMLAWRLLPPIRLIVRRSCDATLGAQRRAA
jgi:hypothetical protein